MNDRDELGRLRAALAQSEQERGRLRMFLDRIARGDGGGAFCKCGDIAIAALAGSATDDPTRPDMAKVTKALKGMQEAFRSLTPEQQNSLNESWGAGTVIGSAFGDTADYAPAAKIKESPVMPAYREALRALNETRAALEQVTAERDAAHAREVVLREALEIFADRDNWGMDDKFLPDEFGILIADRALKGGAK